MLTFMLVVALMFPNGEVKEFVMGTDMDKATCETTKERAVFQITDTLSVATLVDVTCVAEVSA